jgi:hyperosmotically inducible periplasmic protein
MGCFLRTILLLVVLGVVGLLGYNYWSGRGWTLQLPPGSGSIDADAAKQRGAELTKEAAQKAGEAAAKLEEAVSEGTLTAKIKSKMALDDYVKARAIAVSTTDGVVTLTGVVRSTDERERAVRLARETEGVTRVIDKLEVKTP